MTPYFLQELKDNTEFKYEWSYIVSWIGVGLALISSILFRYKLLSLLKSEADTTSLLGPPYFASGSSHTSNGFSFAGIMLIFAGLLPFTQGH